VHVDVLASDDASAPRKRMEEVETNKGGLQSILWTPARHRPPAVRDYQVGKLEALGCPPPYTVDSTMPAAAADICQADDQGLLTDTTVAFLGLSEVVCSATRLV
jgi:hypothetical protein